VIHIFKTATFAAILGSFGAAALMSPVLAADPSWMDKDLLAKAKKEGSLVVYASMNEKEGSNVYGLFQKVTGIKVEYVRSSDNGLMARITVEKRARKNGWDILQTTALHRLPKSWLAQIDPPLAKDIPKEAKDPGRRWFGLYSNYNAPAYNTKLVKKSDLPRTYEDLIKKKEWAGKIAIDYSDEEWMYALCKHYGDKKCHEIVEGIVKNLKPVVTKGHLAMARQVGAGEYPVALNNYVNLTMNVKMRGAPTDYWVLEPVAVFYGQVGVNSEAPHPNAARLVANFLLSREGQQKMTEGGRIPTRADVDTNPPGVLEQIKGKAIVSTVISGTVQKKWTKEFKKYFSRQ
jgi:iron(III) transport system substrate-binding protein